MRKLIITLLIFTLLLTSISVNADDNATSGDGNTSNALADKGFYRGSEYMYKVSVYIGLSDTATNQGSLGSDFKMIGNAPIYIMPSHFSLPANVSFGLPSKMDVLNGNSLSANYNPQIIVDNPPPIPITNGGNIGSVKSYFGDTNTLIGLIDKFAEQKGTTREGLVSSLTFSVEGEATNLEAHEVLPIKQDGIYQNKVPWVIIYEPVIIAYLKDRSTVLAFTATEYALAQKLGYFNFRSGADGQYISEMTHSNLPNSVILEESWFGYPVTTALPDGQYWSEDRIIQGGGWGMRILKASGQNTIDNDTAFDYNYRTDTDVITSVRIFAVGDNITPDDPATITFQANGTSSSTEITVPEGGSQLVFIKWHTPNDHGEVNINVIVSGNMAARLDENARSANIVAYVSNLNEKIPPNPMANDTAPSGFMITSAPVKVQKNSLTWGEWKSHWEADWQWESNWVWIENWVKDYYTKYHSNGCQDSDGNGSNDYCPGHRKYRWIDSGQWEDQGEWVDKGDWAFEWTEYTASLNASFIVAPDVVVPTGNPNLMKSGYGIQQRVETSFYSDAPSSHITPIQNVLSYYPEFNYLGYLRLLESTSTGFSPVFELQKNLYSTYNHRVHFTPIWFPDGPYTVYVEVIDAWTPAGMLSYNMTDTVTIQGSLYDDWHIGPTM